MAMGIALVTGATSGIGEEFCWQLAAAHHDLVLVARREEKLRKLAEDLRQIAGVKAEVIVADLGVAGDVDRVAQRLLDEQSPVGLLVNNAGFALGCSFIDNTIEAEENALDVMVRAPMVLSYAALNAMRARGRGAIINVSSVASETGAGTYSAHKAWIRAFSEGLSEELRGSGVTVTAVCPGPVHSRAGCERSFGCDATRSGIGNSDSGLQSGNGRNASCSALGHAPRHAFDSAYVAFCVVNGGIDASVLLL